MSGHLEFRDQVRETRDAMRSMFDGPTDRSGRPDLPELQPLPVTEPGFYDMTAAEYHADPCPEPSLSASLACAFITSTPAHARLKHPRLAPQPPEQEEAEHFDIGECAHAVFLEGRDVVQILAFDNFRTNAAREARDAARASGRVPLLRKVWADVEAMVRTTRTQLDAHEDGVAMFTNGLPEPVLVWREDGLWMRARLDWLRVAAVRSRSYAIDDYKTASAKAGGANPEQLGERTFWNNGWDVKASFYRRGLYALTGYGAEFRFAVQETCTPYALSVVAPGPSAEMLGDMKVAIAIDKWRRGLRENDWRAYPTRTAYVDVPAWMEKKWADREVRDGV